jgi:hypothetical protein
VRGTSFRSAKMDELPRGVGVSRSVPRVVVKIIHKRYAPHVRDFFKNRRLEDRGTPCDAMRHVPHVRHSHLHPES